MKDLIDIKYWIFELDNTLYSGQTQVFSEVDKKMSSFISEKFNVDLVKAKEIQKKYFYEYGTTLSGLMNHDNIDPLVKIIFFSFNLISSSLKISSFGSQLISMS